MLAEAVGAIHFSFLEENSNHQVQGCSWNNTAFGIPSGLRFFKVSRKLIGTT